MLVEGHITSSSVALALICLLNLLNFKAKYSFKNWHCNFNCLLVLRLFSISQLSASPRSHPFPPMNSNHRRLVHEIAMFYNCSSRSYDQEPKRSTVVTATKLVFMLLFYFTFVVLMFEFTAFSMLGVCVPLALSCKHVQQT